MADSAELLSSESLYERFKDKLATEWKREAACGAEYEGKQFFVATEKLAEWMLRKDPHRSSPNAAKLLLEAYRRNHRETFQPEFSVPIFTGDKRCILVFSILLTLDIGDLVDIFQRARIYDKNLAFAHRCYKDLEEELKMRNIQDVARIIIKFEEAKWSYCPARISMDMEERFHRGTILPFCRRQRVNTEGGTAEVYRVSLQEDLVPDEMKKIIRRSKHVDKDYGVCYRLALKSFNSRNQAFYTWEKNAFLSIREKEGVVQYLGDFSCDGGPAYDPTPRTYNMLLEYGDQDLDGYFADQESYPPVRTTEILVFWKSLFKVADAISTIQTLPSRYEDGSVELYHGCHADAKPGNIWRVHGEFKLADFGFAKFKRKGKTVPSYGCVLSIAATWIVLGFQGVRQFEAVRMLALKKLKRQNANDRLISTPTADDAFYDGTDPLPEVLEWHQYLRGHLRISDTVTLRVLNLVDEAMLLALPNRRISSEKLCERLGKILALCDIDRDKRNPAMDPSKNVLEALLEYEKKAEQTTNARGLDSTRTPSSTDTGSQESSLLISGDRHYRKSKRVGKIEKLDNVRHAQTAGRAEMLEEELKPDSKVLARDDRSTLPSNEAPRPELGTVYENGHGDLSPDQTRKHGKSRYSERRRSPFSPTRHPLVTFAEPEESQQRALKGPRPDTQRGGFWGGRGGSGFGRGRSGTGGNRGGGPWRGGGRGGLSTVHTASHPFEQGFFYDSPREHDEDMSRHTKYRGREPLPRNPNLLRNLSQSSRAESSEDETEAPSVSETHARQSEPHSPKISTVKVKVSSPSTIPIEEPNAAPGSSQRKLRQDAIGLALSNATRSTVVDPASIYTSQQKFFPPTVHLEAVVENLGERIDQSANQTFQAQTGAAESTNEGHLKVKTLREESPPSISHDGITSNRPPLLPDRNEVAMAADMSYLEYGTSAPISHPEQENLANTDEATDGTCQDTATPGPILFPSALATKVSPSFDIYQVRQEFGKVWPTGMGAKLLSFAGLTPTKKDAVLKDYMKNRNIKFVVDNATTMLPFWEVATFVAETLAMKLAGLDDDGLDLMCTLGDVNLENEKGLQAPINIRHAMDRARPSSDGNAKTDMRETLEDIFEDFLGNRKLAKDRKMTLIVLTDGIWKGPVPLESVEAKIEEFVKQLNTLKDRAFSIQFIRFGDDAEAIERLRRLDDDLSKKPDMRDIIDTVPWTGKVRRMIIGSFNSAESADMMNSQGQLHADPNESPERTSANIASRRPPLKLWKMMGIGKGSDKRRKTAAGHLDKTQSLQTDPSSTDAPKIHNNASSQPSNPRMPPISQVSHAATSALLHESAEQEQNPVPPPRPSSNETGNLPMQELASKPRMADHMMEDGAHPQNSASESLQDPENYTSSTEIIVDTPQDLESYTSSTEIIVDTSQDTEIYTSSTEIIIDTSSAGRPTELFHLQRVEINEADECLQLVDAAMVTLMKTIIKLLLKFAQSECMDGSESSGPRSTATEGGSSSIRGASSSRAGASRESSGRKRQHDGGKDPGGGSGESDNDNDDDDRKKKKYGKAHKPNGPASRRLRCPYHQREPGKYREGGCAGKGFDTISHLKFHLSRVHLQPPICERCWRDMASNEARRSHLRREPSEMCDSVPQPEDDRISPETLKESLNFQKSPYANKSDEEKWKLAYKVIFPQDSDEEIPSPYEVQKTDTRLLKFLAETILEELTMLLGPTFESIMTQIKEKIPAMILQCRSRLQACHDNPDYFNRSSSKAPSQVFSTHSMVDTDPGSPITPHSSTPAGAVTVDKTRLAAYASGSSGSALLTREKKSPAFEPTGSHSLKFYSPCSARNLGIPSEFGRILQDSVPYASGACSSPGAGTQVPGRSFPTSEVPEPTSLSEEFDFDQFLQDMDPTPQFAPNTRPYVLSRFA
ncbi:hypothetical protein BU16DRAFT_622209 [Lophium mytilinum]|uniref:Protein kinase domain-containing protein n=1 Tax=Lophium mytilinum TaxID=390894 RepID=A0A6A6QE05_9PEZI|nr:hypothetical protein BU16DRAFT_622209 [Lophium mytilinum]